MHILAIPSWYPSEKNPFNGNFIERHLELIAKNHQVSVLVFQTHASSEIKIELNTKENLNIYSIFYPKRKTKIAQYFALRKAFLKVSKQIKEVDLVHSHVMLDKGIVAVWAKKLYSAPLVVTEHGSYLFREKYSELSLFQKYIMVQTIKNARAISCVSNILQEEIKYLFPRSKVCITPNLVNRELFSISEESKSEILKFIHISTLEKVKNVDEIIRGFEIFSENNSNFELTIISEVQNKAIENQINASKIKDQITLIGPISSEKVAEKLKESCALIVLSSYETFSCVIAEAWSSGVPVLATPVGIAKNLAPHLGIQIQEASEKALNLALQEFIAQKSTFVPTDLRAETLAYSETEVLKSFEHFYSNFK